MGAARDDAARRRRFEELVADAYEPLQRYLLRRTDRATADDVLADALLVLWRRLEDVPDDGALAWAYGVARGCLANSRRGAVRQERVALRLARERGPGEPEPDDGLDEAMRALPEADRELLRLWAWEQLPPREIALTLGVSANAVSIRLHRAKQRLREQLQIREGGDDAGQSGVREGGGAQR